MPAPTVTIIPGDTSIEVKAGTALLDAIVAAQGDIEASCGGSGGCGQCRVRVTAGAVEHLDRSCLDAEELAEGWVLACSSRVIENVTVHVPAEMAAAQPSGAEAVNHDATPTRPVEGLVHKSFIEVDPPSLDNSFGDLERLRIALGEESDSAHSFCGLDTLQSLPRVLRESGHRVTATLAAEGYRSRAHLVKIEPGDTVASAFGVAIDVGTTTCAVHLANLNQNSIAATGIEYNRQLNRGLDIISRINYARQPERRAELRQLILETLNGIIHKLCDENGVSTTDIDSACVAGNTTMMHLMLGLDPEYIRLDPYTPVANVPPLDFGHELGLAIHPNAPILIAPGVGSYVGGDITAGLLRTVLASATDEVSLFLDIGTNGEAVVGNGEWLLACAASAGPAFEGSGIRCGMRADPGAVERVRIDTRSGRAEVSVIGGGKARGICGSGAVDLLAELWTAGLIDASGKLDAARGGGLVQPRGDTSRNLSYTLVDASDSATGEDLLIDQHDIQNLLRTKAAVYGACSFMLRSVGLEFSAIDRVYVAGGFGRFLDIGQAIAIGMLPEVPVERFIYLGNASLAGAHAMLTSSEAREKVVELASRITYLELNVDPAYMDEYTAALFLPHTDPARFPSVQARRPS